MFEIYSNRISLLYSSLPFLLIVLGIITILISLSERLRWRFNWSSERQIKFLPIGALVLAIGVVWLILPEVGRLSGSDSPEPTSTTVREPFVEIGQPTSVVACSDGIQACHFRLEGVAIAPNGGQDVLVFGFLFPNDPPGPGYYLQSQPAALGGEGTWSLTAKFQPSGEVIKSGQSFDILAVLVQRDASYNGLQLTDLPDDFYLSSVEDIEGLIAQSQTVRLNVE